jgi:hypothetical protein
VKLPKAARSNSWVTARTDMAIWHAAFLLRKGPADSNLFPVGRGEADAIVHQQINQTPGQSGAAAKAIEEAAADKGYHAGHTLELATDLSLRTYIPEPRRPHRSRWTDKPPEVHQAVQENRRRTKRAKSKKLQRRRSEVCERTFAHVCDTGGARRSWLRGLEKVTKRYLIAAAAHNLGRILRKLFGFGKPKTLQDQGSLAAVVYLVILHVMTWLRPSIARLRLVTASGRAKNRRHENSLISTGC